MSESAMGDDVYQPTGDDEVADDATQLDMENALDERGLDDILDEGYSPPERPLGVDKVGTTAEEQHEGESLDERLAQEVPDTTADTGDGLGDTSDTDGELLDTEAGVSRSGRLVAPDEGVGSNREGTVAADVGIDGAAASAEEAAVHVVDDPESTDGEI
ncbi:DUF5709 domain-containing protein [Streptomyces sp. H39-S7]|uniref:DUF5709 domain-containing protein n=1 Tax=Streptomyces sp. H39-S7 TaxID=3004357 RepID=UPI0022AE6C14|nr:DUF5709 domain-containing protein [Streptomyces sp. H39-S7]MCZ4119873.1 DUF5709 domain-containing protein [Streptomyces sp. H39-S7]